MKNLKIYIFVFVLYLTLSLIFTWPLANNLSTNGFGHDEDLGYHLWHNWWFKYSLFDLKQNPLRTDYIFHPQKLNLIYDANAFIFSALTLPFQFLTGNVVLSSNLILLFSFALAGVFAFLLTNYLITNYSISFLVGIIFAFNPYTTAQALDGHINLTSTWLVPLYTLLLVKSLSSISADKDQISKIKSQKSSRWLNLSIANGQWSTAAGLVAALQLYNDFTYTAFLVIETGLVFLFFAFQNRQRILVTTKRISVIGLIISLTASFLGTPLLLEVWRAGREGFRAGSPLWVQNVWSADLLTFIRPNDQTTFLKNPWTPNIGTVEGTAFVGYTVLALAVIYFLGRLLPKPKREKRELKTSQNPPANVSRLPTEASAREGETFTGENLMVFLSVSFFLLMLGPSLHYKNQFRFDLLGRSLIFPLPYILLHKIPFIGETQEPGRLFPFFILPTAILASLVIRRLNLLIGRRDLTFILNSLFLILIITEYLTIPFPTTDLRPSPIFDVIRSDPERKSVLILPVGFNSGNYVLGQSPIGSLQFYQTYFQKPSFRATVARLPYANFEYYQKLPLFPYLLDPESPIIFDELLKNKEWIKAVFKNQLQIKYLLVFEKKYKKSMGETYRVIEQILDGQKIYDQEFVKGYLI